MEMHQMDRHLAAAEQHLERRISMLGGAALAAGAALVLIAVAEWGLWVIAVAVLAFMALCVGLALTNPHRPDAWHPDRTGDNRP